MNGYYDYRNNRNSSFDGFRSVGTNRPLKYCAICGDSAMHSFYGSISCDACRVKYCFIRFYHLIILNYQLIILNY